MYTTIYCLYKNDIPFYIGKSNNPKHRKYDHQRSYGKDIVLEEIDYVLKTEWGKWEKWWISLYKSWGFNLLNRNDGGGGCIGNIERNQKSNNWKTIPVVMWDKNVKPIKIWRSRNEAAKWLNIHPVNIGRACNGQVHQAGGYLWSYIGNKPRIFPHQGGVAVIQYNKNGKIIKEYSSAKEAGMLLNINYKAIWKVLNNNH
jgi:hypothetical protein